MKTVAGTLNLIVNTASAKHDLNAYLDLLARYKALTLTRHNPINISLIFQKRFKWRLDIFKTQNMNHLNFLEGILKHRPAYIIVCFIAIRLTSELQSWNLIFYDFRDSTIVQVGKVMEPNVFYDFQR